MTVKPTLPRAPRPTPPNRPQNALHAVANGVGTVVGAPMMAVDALNTGFASATNSIAQALPCFPAATMGSIAFGAPHAHIAHPPSGPPPVPPTPLPPIGPVMLGCCVQVLINGKPAARAGDIGLSPTCCGLPVGLYEVKTGSSKVFIGGCRASRQLDITHHCTPAATGAACRAATKAAKVAAAAAKVASVAAKGMMVAGMGAQALTIAGDTVEAVEADTSAMSAALGMNASLMAAQMAADAAAMAAAAAMGKDQPMIPPTGTFGAILANTSPNVMIGGFPMPMWMDIAKGFMKVVKGLRGRRRKGPGLGIGGYS